MFSFKTAAVGSSAGVILPREAAAHMKVKKGDTLYLAETLAAWFRQRLAV